MANEFGFFPDEVYGPDDFTTYFRDFYSNGIKAEDTSYFAVTEKIGMTLTVKSGIAYIDGHFYRPIDNATVTLAESDTEFPRIDLVEIKCDYVTNKLYVDVVTGEPSGTPTIPQLQRDAAAYCLGLAAVTVAANTSEVTQADIRDLRFDTDYCGVVVGKIDTISTTYLFSQYEAQWELLKAGCAQDAEAVINAWSALNTVKKVNGVEPIGGNVALTQDNIPSGSTAYQFPYYIQTGVATTSVHGTIAVTFPKAFKSTPLLFLTSKSHSNYGSRASYNSVTNTSFEVKTEWGETNTFSTEFMWLALGEPED